jgi:hypothetical protein
LCIFARRSFDETIAINPETSKLYPLVCDCENGRIENLPSFILAWQVTAQRKMHPVDLMIPFPESIKKSQKRGFWFALELAKKFQITYQIPFERSLIESFEEDNESYTFKIRSKNPNPLPLHNFRVAIILPYMKKDYPVEKLALFLKKLGARWVSVWVLIRDSKKEDY